MNANQLGQRNAAIRSAFAAGAVAKIATVVCSLASVALAIRQTGATEFSVVLLFINMVGIFGFLDFGIGNSLISRIGAASALDQSRTVRDLLSNGIVVLASAATVLLGIVLPLIWFAPDKYLPDAGEQSAITVRATLTIFVVCMALAIPMSLGSKVALAIQVGAQNSYILLASSVSTLVAVGLGFVADLGIVYYTLCFVAIPVVWNSYQTIRIIFMLDPTQRPRIHCVSGRLARTLMISGIPYMAIAFSGAAAYQTHILSVSYIEGAAAAAVFGITLRVFSSVSTLFVAGLQQMWGSFARALAVGDLAWVKSIFYKTLTITIFVAILADIFLCLFGQSIISLWAGPDVVPSIELLVAFSIWTTYNLAMSQCSFLLNSANIMKVQAIASLLMVIVAVPLSIYFTKSMGVVGPLYATLIAHIVTIGMPTVYLVSKIIRGRLLPNLGMSRANVSIAGAHRVKAVPNEINNSNDRCIGEHKNMNTTAVDKVSNRGSMRWTPTTMKLAQVFACLLTFTLVYYMTLTSTVVIIAVGILALIVVYLVCKNAIPGRWAIPLVIPVLFIVSDVLAISSSNGLLRYAVAFAMCVALMLKKNDWDSIKTVQLVAGILFIYGMIGSLYGRIELGATNGALPMIVPLAVVVLAPTRALISESSLLMVAKFCSFISATVTLQIFLAREGIISLPLSVYNHEKAFLVVLAVGGALLCRSRWLLVYAIAASLASFIAYPAATYIVVAFAALATVALFTARITEILRSLLAVVLVSGFVILQVEIETLLGYARNYFNLVGKSDNGSTRLSLYEAALSRIREPIFNEFFTRDVTFSVNLSGVKTIVPSHNDYLTIAVAGGYLAEALLVAIIVLANAMAIRRYNERRGSTQGRVLLVLASTLNASAFSALANPVLMNPGSSLIVFGIVAGIVSVASGYVTTDAGGLSEDSTVSGVPFCRIDVQVLARKSER